MAACAVTAVTSPSSLTSMLRKARPICWESYMTKPMKINIDKASITINTMLACKKNENKLTIISAISAARNCVPIRLRSYLVDFPKANRTKKSRVPDPKPATMALTEYKAKIGAKKNTVQSTNDKNTGDRGASTISSHVISQP